MELNGTDPYTWRRLVRRVRLGPSVKLVASMLADYANVDGTSVRPGNDRLVAVTELSDATVRRALKKLRELGLIERVFAGSRTGRKGLADVYRLTYPDELDAYGELLPPDELPPAPVAVTGDTAGTPVTVTGDDVDKPVDNPGTPVAVTADPDPDPPGTPVTDDQPPVTDDRNTGHQYRPPNQAPNQYTPTNKHSGCPDVVAELEDPAAPTATTTNDDESDWQPREFTAPTAFAYLRTLAPADDLRLSRVARAQLGQKATAEQVAIRAAEIGAKGIPA